jgi:outer membrane protein assembly factor BamB
MGARLYAINTNGSVLWRYPMDSGNGVNYSATAQGLTVDESGTSYFVRHRLDGQGSILSAIDTNGSLLWEYQDAWIGSPAVRDDIIVITSTSKLTALDNDGGVLWAVNGHYYYNVPPAIAADGTIYAITTPFGLSETDFGIVAIDETATPFVIIIVGVVLFAAIIICLVLIWKGR